MLTLIALLGCTAGEDSGGGAAPLAADVVVSVERGAAAATVSERYLSFAIDTAQVAGGVFWNPDDEADEEEIAVEPFDFTSPQLRALAAELAPATLRIGGTAADFAYYDLDGSTDGTTPPGDYGLVLTAAQWDGVVDFAEEVGLDILFTLNAGPGPRDEADQWQGDDMRAFVARSVSRGEPVTVWELGNEINAYSLMHGLSLSPEDYAADLALARAVLDEEAPGSRLAGPSSAFWPVVGEFNDFHAELVPHAGELLDVVTWHYYPQQSVRCPVQSRLATPETMLSAEALDELLVWAEQVEAPVRAHAPGAEVWLGETGNAQCGGQPGVSDAYAGGVWWVDQLGQLARRGQQQVVRQTLAGSDYGLLEDSDLSPNPDYWISVLWRRLMGATVLAATSPDPALRAYAHCHPDGEGVTLALVNIGDQPLAVGADLSGSGDAAEAYILTAPSLDSRTLSLNGGPALTYDGGAMPGPQRRGRPRRRGDGARAELRLPPLPRGRGRRVSVRYRPTARVLLIDPDDRLLLLQMQWRFPIWVTPGGGVEGDETLAAAARRELYEETGQTDVVWLSDGPLWERRHVWTSSRGEQVESHEHFFLARTTSTAVTFLDEEERSELIDWRWWSCGDLAAATTAGHPVRAAPGGRAPPPAAARRAPRSARRHRDLSAALPVLKQPGRLAHQEQADVVRRCVHEAIEWDVDVGQEFRSDLRGCRQLARPSCCRRRFPGLTQPWKGRLDEADGIDTALHPLSAELPSAPPTP